MRRTIKTLIFIPIFLFLINNLACANIHTNGNQKLNSLNGLKNVHSHLLENGHIVRLEFKKPVGSWIKPIFYERTVQIDFPGAFVSPFKKSFAAESSLITNIFATQLDNKALRVRFYTKHGAKDLEKRFKLAQQGRFLIIRFDSIDPFNSYLAADNKTFKKSKNENFEVMDADELAKFLDRASKKIQSQKDEFPPKAINNFGFTKVKEKQPSKLKSEIEVKRAGMGVAPIVNQIRRAALTNVNTDKKASNSKINKSKFTTRENADFVLKDTRPTGKRMELIPSGMKMISMFAVVLGLMFLVFFGFKKYVLKNTAFGGGNKLVSVLGTWFIGPKKNIALVEVAGEVLVLGVSQENITLLSSITSEDKIGEIKNLGDKAKSRIDWDSSHAENLKDRTSSSKERVVGQFSKYLSKFSRPQEVKEKIVADAKQQILNKIGKMKTARG